MELDLDYFSSFVAFSTITYLPLGVRVRSEKKYAGEAVTDEIIIIKICSSVGMGTGVSLFLGSADDCCCPNSRSFTVEDAQASELGDSNLIIFSISFLRSNSRMYSRKMREKF